MITEDILKWVATLPKWQQKLGHLIIEKKHVTEVELNEIYNVFKVENSLSIGKYFGDDIQLYKFETDAYPVVKWQGVKDLHGVNRLKSGVELYVSDGLTIIYGENGSGKSGYTRLINNAFVSRGDQEILSNVYLDKPDDISAVFQFCIDGIPKEYKYPEEKEKYPFMTIRSFDSKSASDDMNRESTIDFAPSELSFFDLFLSGCLAIQDKLNNERKSVKLENPTLKYFPNEGKALIQMKALSANSNIDEIRKSFTISKDEEVFVEKIKSEKANLISLNINKQVELIDKVVIVLESAIKKYNLFAAAVSKDNIDIYNQQIIFLQKCRVLHDTVGTTLFEKDDVELIGSQEWKEFISSAKKYYDLISKHNICPLCGHEIEEKNLIFKYWKYLESDAESNLKTAQEAIRLSREGLDNLELSFLVESSVQEQWLLENYRDEEEQISVAFKTANQIKNAIIKDIESESAISVVALPKINIQDLIKKIEDKKRDLNKDSINKRISECQNIENEYIDKIKVTELLPIVSKYLEQLKWDMTAENSKIKTNNITIKQKELFEKYVTEDYLKEFKEECKKLNADFDVEITSRGSSGHTLKKLQIKGVAPGKVLSEGEQRAISIACFLTEVHMDMRNTGIVLDDPVCSLDHKRRSLIVNRLIEEAMLRQVVIFTHEITFFMEIKTESERKNINFNQVTIRNFFNEPGDISPIIPWQGMTVKDRTGKLKNDLQGIVAVFNKGDMDMYYYKAKEWCELLRESWERAVEEILLNDAIQRYNPCVQTQRLKKAPFTQELYCELESGMTECSAWCHDQARAINGNIPSIEDLRKYIDSFEKYWKENKPR
ncbi:AAA family ATPase [Paludicola sp. MB14-C6]|uniref:AAA family ATPase n=1 Tax=Paludihabitans sp. MB14-C6 TaxID=3070656 RepID=UPI0027DE398D|nr:AAA family ATPase [Paludicola sp. MB14-C6]WMJ24340.1 AAA family ATPase [Paludicola sp. MB14-C6]